MVRSQPPSCSRSRRHCCSRSTRSAGWLRACRSEPSRADMAQIEIRNLHKAFKTDTVLKGLSLSVDKGEIVTLFGPSGTGKTVLLRLLAGIYPPDAGTIGLR